MIYNILAPFAAIKNLIIAILTHTFLSKVIDFYYVYCIYDSDLQ